MQIPKALESMVADLISDEKSKREEVEAVLSQIHSLTEAYFNPEVPKLIDPSSSPNAPRYIEAPVTVDKELESQRKLFEAKGFPADEADRRARGILGIE